MVYAFKFLSGTSALLRVLSIQRVMYVIRGFIVVYWVVSLMVFGGGRGGTIDFVYNRFFYFTVLITLYLVFKYSVHYFFFLRGPLSRGGAVCGFFS